MNALRAPSFADMRARLLFIAVQRGLRYDIRSTPEPGSRAATVTNLAAAGAERVAGAKSPKIAVRPPRFNGAPIPFVNEVLLMQPKAGLPPEKQGLYDPRHEHDACGVGFVAHIKGKKSHDIVANGLSILNNLRHHAAPLGADPLHGDGRRLLVQIPDAFFREEMAKKDVRLPKAGAYGVGMGVPAAQSRRPRRLPSRDRARHRQRGQVLLGWRDVPVDDSSLGETARSTMPVIRRCFVGAGRGSLDRDAFERKLYIIRKSLGHAIRALGLSNAHDFYVPSFSLSHDRLQGHAARRTGGQVLYGPYRQALRVGPCASRTSASRRTRSRPGTSRTRSASSRTTARSTRCAATSTGSGRARLRSTRSCWARISTRSGLSSTTANRTRHRSTMRSSSW